MRFARRDDPAAPPVNKRHSIAGNGIGTARGQAGEFGSNKTILKEGISK
jgi:hypothetical protein